MRVNLRIRFNSLFVIRIYCQRCLEHLLAPPKEKQNKSLLSDACCDKVTEGKLETGNQEMRYARDKVGIQPDLRQVIGFLDTRVWSPFHTRDKAFHAHSITRPAYCSSTAPTCFFKHLYSVDIPCRCVYDNYRL